MQAARAERERGAAQVGWGAEQAYLAKGCAVLVEAQHDPRDRLESTEVDVQGPGIERVAVIFDAAVAGRRRREAGGAGPSAGAADFAAPLGLGEPLLLHAAPSRKSSWRCCWDCEERHLVVLFVLFLFPFLLQQPLRRLLRGCSLLVLLLLRAKGNAYA